MHKIKNSLLLRLLLGILAGILIGSFGFLTKTEDSILFISVVRLFSTFTTLFSSFLSFLIPLLILSFVAVSLAELGTKANRLIGITLLTAYLSTILAGFMAYWAGSAILPRILSTISADASTHQGFEPYISLNLEPVFGVMTALILAFLLGLGLANTNGKYLFETINDLKNIISLVLNKGIIPLIPIHIAGMFCLIAAKGELASTIQVFLKLFLMIILLQWFYIFLQFLVVSLICKKNYMKQLRKILPAYFTALGTQSSALSIPISLSCAKENGIADDIADFVVPLCATIHLAGDTICLVLGSLGILLANGITPSFTMFAPFILMLGFTMIAAPGIPGGGVMAALGLLTSLLSFSPSMQQLMISLHLTQDSFGTACNVAGDQAISFFIHNIDRNSKHSD